MCSDDLKRLSFQLTPYGVNILFVEDRHLPLLLGLNIVEHVLFVIQMIELESQKIKPTKKSFQMIPLRSPVFVQVCCQIKELAPGSTIQITCRDSTSSFSTFLSTLYSNEESIVLLIYCHMYTQTNTAYTCQSYQFQSKYQKSRENIFPFN